MTWLDVIDSAVKIGLGAIVGGVFSVIVLRMNHQNERTKEIRSHKIKMVEKAVDLSEEFFNAHAKYLSRLTWIVEKAGGAPIAIDLEMGAALKERDTPLIERADGSRVATSRLSLLSAEKCADSLKTVTVAAMDFRNEIMRKGALPSSDELEDHKQKFVDMRTNFQRHIAELYASL